MPSADRRVLLAVLLLALSPLLVASRSASDNLIVVEDDVVDEDLYAVATNLRVSGVIEGDLVVTSLQTALIDGVVQGDVQLIASQVDITGRVEGGARIVADQIVVSGSVADDAVLIGRTVQVSGQIGRDLLLWGGDAVVRGDVRREVLVAVLDQAVFSAAVGDGAEIIADRILFESGATFSSGVRARAGSVEGTDLVDGRVTIPSEFPMQIRVRALIVSAVLAAAALMIGLWLSLFWLAPATVRESVVTASAQPGRALVNGLGVLGAMGIVLVGPPLIGLIAFPEAALGVYVFGGPLFILFAALLLVAWFVGAVPAATVVGGRIAAKASPLSAFVVGAVAIGLLLLIPYVRWLVLVPLTGGVGALWLGAARNRGSTDWLRLPAKEGADRRRPTADG